jgi:hypothetical protein
MHRLRICKSEVPADENEIATVRYELNYLDIYPSGSGEIEVMDSRCYPITNNLFQGLYRPSDKLAEITVFFPHGYMDKRRIEKFSRKGIGSALMEEMLGDSRRYGADAIFIITNREMMHSMATNKHGFIQDDVIGTYHLRLLP